MHNMYDIVDTQCEIIRLQSNVIDEMMGLLIRYLDLDEIEHLTFFEELDMANKYKKEIDM